MKADAASAATAPDLGQAVPGTTQDSLAQAPYSAALDAITDGVWVLDRTGTVVYSNGRFEETLGIKEDLVRSNCSHGGGCRAHSPVGCLFQQMLRAGEVREAEFQDSGTGKWLRATMYPIRDASGQMTGATHVVRDITRSAHTERRHRLLQATVDQSPDVVMVVSMDMSVTYVNPAFERFVGRSAEELVGTNAMQLESHFGGEAGFVQMERAHRTGEPYRGLLTATDREGKPVTLDGRVEPLTDETGTVTHLVCSGRDLTHQQELEGRVQHLAYFDALTELPNRSLFLERLGPALARAVHGGRACAVVSLDLDKFKAINDAYGTSVGDDVLRQVTASLNSVVREGDTVARLGSDDFGLALIDMKWPEDAPRVLEKVERALSTPVTVGDEEIEITASAGIALCPVDGREPADLLQKAGIALTAARAGGPGSTRYYSADMGTRAEEFMTTAARLRRAVERDEFRAYYQPYYDIASGELAGMEALIRWQTEDRGIVAPYKFIPVLEETGLIVQAGEWMIREVCRQIRTWQADGKPVVPVAINLSPLQFRTESLMEAVRGIIADTGIDPHLLTFEVTESTFMENPEYTRSVLTSLRELGAKVSIDDFGTGYSSLAYLKRFPVDHLKIDQSFIRDIVEDVDDASLVSAIISMAHNLGIQTIAEGVETQDHLRILRILRCDIAQGYLYTPPVPPADEDKLFG